MSMAAKKCVCLFLGKPYNYSSEMRGFMWAVRCARLMIDFGAQMLDGWWCVAKSNAKYCPVDCTLPNGAIELLYR
jgi:hypothetical protein